MATKAKTPEAKRAARTRALARQYAERGLENIDSWLLRATGGDPAGSPGQLARIHAAERRRLVDEFRAQRHEGRHNDPASIGNGLVALVGPDVEKQVVEEYGGQPRFEGAYSFEGRARLGSSLDWYQMRLPRGVFGHDPEEGRIDFYMDAEILPGLGFTEGVGRIGLNSVEVLRIEGDAGELWQSTFWTPDGTRNTAQTVQQ
jgi:hypothetical protein